MRVYGNCIDRSTAGKQNRARVFDVRISCELGGEREQGCDHMYETRRGTTGKATRLIGEATRLMMQKLGVKIAD